VFLLGVCPSGSGAVKSTNNSTTTSTLKDGGGSMQKALMYEAIFIVNRGIDDAVIALERLKSNRDAQEAGLTPAFLDQKLIDFEMHRTTLRR
jgi:hypothetical protein